MRDISMAVWNRSVGHPGINGWKGWLGRRLERLQKPCGPCVEGPCRKSRDRKECGIIGEPDDRNNDFLDLFCKHVKQREVELSRLGTEYGRLWISYPWNMMVHSSPMIAQQLLVGFSTKTLNAVIFYIFLLCTWFKDIWLLCYCCFVCAFNPFH